MTHQATRTSFGSPLCTKDQKMSKTDKPDPADRVVKIPANPAAGLFGRRMTPATNFPRPVDNGPTHRAA